MKLFALGKYRDLVIAIALFLVLDLGVLVFSFYVSTEIRSDASRINAASEIRMLTQQATKSLLTLKDETVQGLPNQTSLAQLSGLLPVFHGNLARLKADFEQSQTNQIQQLLLGHRMADNATQLARVAKTWAPLGEALATVVARPDPPLEDVDYAATKSVAINIKLMAEANDLTLMLEETAAQRGTSLRYVQLAGILLAMLNFVFIVFKFLRTLNAADRKALAAKHETDNILATVQEGLMLVRTDGSVSAQYSASLPDILGVPVVAGMHVGELFRKALSDADQEAAMEFVDLLLGGRVMASMVKQLNPLEEVRLAHGTDRFAAFEFTPVKPMAGAADVAAQDALLISVKDVTHRKALEDAVVTAKEQARVESEILSQLLHSDAGSVRQFFEAAQADLDEVNTALRDTQAAPGAYQPLVSMIFRVVHNLKGQAATLNLKSVELEAHRFEDLLSELQRRRALSGKDLIGVSVAMGDLRARIARVAEIADKLAGFARIGAPSTEDAKNVEAQASSAMAVTVKYLTQLAQRIATDEHKEVALDAKFAVPEDLSSKIMAITKDILPQLVRNAVVHGIEPPTERERLGKPRQGSIVLSVASDAEQGIAIHVRDDGRGLSFEAIRQSLRNSSRLSAEEIAALTDHQLVAQIFEPGISTAHATGLHAGRGVGLDVVKDIVSRVGGRIRVRSRVNGHTEFQLIFPRTAFS